jgi:hypothetical protein
MGVMSIDGLMPPDLAKEPVLIGDSVLMEFLRSTGLHHRQDEDRRVVCSA